MLNVFYYVECYIRKFYLLILGIEYIARQFIVFLKGYQNI